MRIQKLLAAAGQLTENQSICRCSYQLTGPSDVAVRQLSSSLCSSAMQLSKHHGPAAGCLLGFNNSRDLMLGRQGRQPPTTSATCLSACQARGYSTVAAESNSTLSTDATSAPAATSGTMDSVAGGNDVATTSGRIHTPPAQRKWDWRWVVGDAQGRKPAIKRPQRHQWHYCNPAYDPHQPLPTKMLPPHAPPPVEGQDEWRLFRQIRDQHQALHPSSKDTTPEGYRLSNRRIKQQFLRWARLREVDWRVAFERGVAEDITDLKAHRRVEEERSRQQAWQQYREHVFQAALEAPAEAEGAPVGLKP